MDKCLKVRDHRFHVVGDGFLLVSLRTLTDGQHLRFYIIEELFDLFLIIISAGNGLGAVLDY